MPDSGRRLWPAAATTAIITGLLATTAYGAVITGTPGNDRIHGKAEADQINALTGNDRVHARRGDDTVDLGPGDDRAFGGRGNDTIGGFAGDSGRPRRPPRSSPACLQRPRPARTSRGPPATTASTGRPRRTRSMPSRATTSCTRDAATTP